MYTKKPHWRNCQWGFCMDMCGENVKEKNIIYNHIHKGN